MAFGLWLWIGCIIIKEMLLEDVVEFMWHGRETSGGQFCELRGKGDVKVKEFIQHNILASQEYFCGSDIVNSDKHKC